MIKGREVFAGIVAGAAVTTAASCTPSPESDPGSLQVVTSDSTGPGSLTEKIIQSNETPGVQTITFNINEEPDFMLGGVNGYRIDGIYAPIRDTVVIKGETQPGYRPNTNPIDKPFNGLIPIEIDASNVQGGGGCFVIEANLTAISGLAIGGCRDRADGSGGDAFGIGADQIKLSAFLAGFHADGSANELDGLGVGQARDGSSELHVGGAEPSSRFMVGNTKTGGISPNYGSDNWTIQNGSVGEDPNLNPADVATETNAGGISLDNSNNHVVRNMRISNSGHGVAPYNSSGVLIEDTVVFNNRGQGITFGGGSKNSTTRNVKAYGNASGGIGYHEGSGDAVIEDVTIHDNPIGIEIYNSPQVLIKNADLYENSTGVSAGDDSTNVQIDSSRIVSNTTTGIVFQSGASSSQITNSEVSSDKNAITVFDSSNVTIGQTGKGNKIIGAVELVQVFGETKGTQIIQNEIDASSSGLLNAGGVISVRSGVEDTTIAENTIRDNDNVTAITIQDLIAPAIGFAGIPTDTAVIGNTLRGTIDRNTATDTSNPPDGLADVVDNIGPTPNGIEGYMNKPVIEQATFDGQNLQFDIVLDAVGSDSNSYLVQFYAKVGEDYIPIGSAVTSNGSRTLSVPKPEINLPVGTEIVATASAIFADKPAETSETTDPIQTQ